MGFCGTNFVFIMSGAKASKSAGAHMSIVTRLAVISTVMSRCAKASNVKKCTALYVLYCLGLIPVNSLVWYSQHTTEWWRGDEEKIISAGTVKRETTNRPF